MLDTLDCEWFLVGGGSAGAPEKERPGVELVHHTDVNVKRIPKIPKRKEIKWYSFTIAFVVICACCHLKQGNIKLRS
jgi:hypothetical protein